MSDSHAKAPSSQRKKIKLSVLAPLREVNIFKIVLFPPANKMQVQMKNNLTAALFHIKKELIP